MPAFFAPARQLVKNNLTIEELKAKNKDYTPFVQIKLTQSEINDKEIYIKKYKGLQVQIQEMKLEIETGLVSALLKFMYEIQSVQNVKAQFLSGYTFQ